VFYPDAVEASIQGKPGETGLNKEVHVNMTISLEQLIIWVIIAAIVGVVGEFIARRHAPGGIVGAILLGLLAIFLVDGVLHWHISGEPYLNGVPLVTSVLAAAVLVFIWSAFAYRRLSPYYYRRGSYAHRPRRWWRW
jgi:uncharacterized membrane protein YeaQ/YmgE (transglycosylase-associated protein family)